MPLYEYECRQCRRRLERIERFSDTPQTRCEACGGEVERLVSPSAFQFKGTGWYVTDYARQSGGNVESSSQGNGAGEKAKTEKSEKSAPAESKAAESPSQKS
jgi:putative FmdB family regulatory protein